jgi:predicted glycoside hydrolase/deacetylase ChbG (UPF0249 family)
MIRWPAARDAVAMWRDSPRMGLGLHLDLGEWILRDGKWDALYEVAPLDDRIAVATEITRQITAFQDLTGCNPTHLDSHQHVHLRPIIRTIAIQWGEQLWFLFDGCRRKFSTVRISMAS